MLFSTQTEHPPVGGSVGSTCAYPVTAFTDDVQNLPIRPPRLFLVPDWLPSRRTAVCLLLVFYCSLPPCHYFVLRTIFSRYRGKCTPLYVNYVFNVPRHKCTDCTALSDYREEHTAGVQYSSTNINTRRSKWKTKQILGNSHYLATSTPPAQQLLTQHISKSKQRVCLCV